MKTNPVVLSTELDSRTNGNNRFLQYKSLKYIKYVKIEIFIEFVKVSIRSTNK